MDYTIPYSFQLQAKLFCKDLITNHSQDITQVKSIITDIIKVTCSNIYSLITNPSETDGDSLLTISGINSIDELKTYINTNSLEYISNELRIRKTFSCFIQHMISYELDFQTNYNPLSSKWKYPYYLSVMLNNEELLDIPSVMFYYEYPPEEIILIFESSNKCLNYEETLAKYDTDFIHINDIRVKLINQITTYDLWTQYMITIRDIMDDDQSDNNDIVESLYVYKIIMEYAIYIMSKKV